jgi:hypothetical protein
MSYLANPASTTEYGVVEIGNFIDVIDGIISIPQSVATNANVTFETVNANTGNFSGNISAVSANFSSNITAVNANISGNLYAAGNLVVTSVTPTAGVGISVSNVVSNGYAASFTVTNTGVTYLNAGSGISLSGNTGNITISSFGADLINVTGVTANYTATITDEYIGVFSANAVTISLPPGFDGRVYTIKDEYGQGSGKITIQPSVGELIDNKVSYVISVPNQSVSVVSRASKWYII